MTENSVFTRSTAPNGERVVGGVHRAMNTIRRDGTGDDTGEQDVRELRRQASNEAAPRSEPHVRHREDVPHEHAIPDFYGPEDNVIEGDEVDAELSELVDSGELCMGWDSERQEVIYWLPEDNEVVGQREPAVKKRSLRARKPRRRSSAYRRVILTLAACIAPFIVGMAAEAALDMHAEHNPSMDQPDMVGNTVPDAATTKPRAGAPKRIRVYQLSDAGRAKTGKHAKVTTSPTVEKPGSYVGKHRKVIGDTIVKVVKAPRKVPAPRQRPHTPAESLVISAMHPLHFLM